MYKIIQTIGLSQLSKVSETYQLYRGTPVVWAERDWAYALFSNCKKYAWYCSTLHIFQEMIPTRILSEEERQNGKMATKSECKHCKLMDWKKHGLLFLLHTGWSLYMLLFIHLKKSIFGFSLFVNFFKFVFNKSSCLLKGWKVGRTSAKLCQNLLMELIFKLKQMFL